MVVNRGPGDNWRWCGTCQDNKPRSEFYKKSTSPSGLANNCKACSKEFHKERIRQGFIKIKKNKTKNPRDLKGFDEQPTKIKQIITALYENPKLTAQELGALVNLAPPTVDVYMRQNSFLKSLRTAGSRAMTKLIPNAVKSFQESLEGPNADVKLKAAVKLLESEKVLGPERIDITTNDLSDKTYDELVQILSNLDKQPILQPAIEAEVIS